jgi:hypothetical protein
MESYINSKVKRQKSKLRTALRADIVSKTLTVRVFYTEMADWTIKKGRGRHPPPGGQQPRLSILALKTGEEETIL